MSESPTQVDRTERHLCDILERLRAKLPDWGAKSGPMIAVVDSKQILLFWLRGLPRIANAGPR